MTAPFQHGRRDNWTLLHLRAGHEHVRPSGDGDSGTASSGKSRKPHARHHGWHEGVSGGLYFSRFFQDRIIFKDTVTLNFHTVHVPYTVGIAKRLSAEKAGVEIEFYRSMFMKNIPSNGCSKTFITVWKFIKFLTLNMADTWPKFVVMIAPRSSWTLHDICLMDSVIHITFSSQECTHSVCPTL